MQVTKKKYLQARCFMAELRQLYYKLVSDFGSFDEAQPIVENKKICTSFWFISVRHTSMLYFLSMYQIAVGFVGGFDLNSIVHHHHYSLWFLFGNLYE